MSNSLSIYDPIYFGVDEYDKPVRVTLAGRNMLIGGEPGGGKSVALNSIVAHAALCLDVELVLIDGKLVELLPWARVADEFVANEPARVIEVLRDLVAEMDRRYLHLARTGNKKIKPDSGIPAILCAIDEFAYFSVTAGTTWTQEEFVRLVADLVARGRAAGIIMVVATQRPSADIIPTKLRDLFAYRLAFRCTTDSSSDIILSVGWASEGYSAKKIAPEDKGVGWLLAEGGTPRRIKNAYLTDEDITILVGRAAYVRDITTTREGVAA